MLGVTRPVYEASHGNTSFGGGIMENTGSQVHDIIGSAEANKPTTKEYLDTLEATNNAAYRDIEERAISGQISIESFVDEELTAYYFEVGDAQMDQYIELNTLYVGGSIISHNITHNSDTVSNILHGGFQFVGWGIKLPKDSMPPFVMKV